jgi:parallel beta-helix repeat protein
MIILGTPLLSANHPYLHRNSDARIIATVLYEEHDPLVIGGDEEFALNGFTGSGTAEDPYVINELNITSRNTGITIMNTTAYFILRDCFVKATYSDHGIILQNVTFGSIEGCKATVCHSGIYLQQAMNCTIENSTVYSCRTGIFLNSAYFCNISNSKIFRNADGIRINAGDYSRVTGNRVYRNTDTGISLGTGVRNCTVYENKLGRNGGMYPYTQESNAEDYGQDNIWDDDANTGNYWTDYDGNGSYEIDTGTAFSVDRHPQILNDTSAPTINSPSDVIFEQGPSGVNVTWAPRDEFPYEYVLRKDGILLTKQAWDGEDIEIHMTSAQSGWHNFTLFVYDAFGNVVNDTIFANVIADVFGGAGTELVAAASLVSVVAVVIVLLAVKKMR